MGNLTIMWLIAGGTLCLMELVFPTAFVAFMLGIGALLTAVLSLVFASLPAQVSLWLGLSTGLILLSRRFFTPKRTISSFGDDLEAQTITTIPAGAAGRVLYEGNSWRAKCADHNLTIAPHQTVHVVRKEGNTLIVLPSNIIEA